MRVRKHWKKQLTVVDPLDFSPGLLRIQAQPPTPFARALLYSLLTLLELNYWGRSPIKMKRMGLRPHVVVLAADQGGANTLTGGSGDDTLSATDGDNWLDAGEGNNLLVADGGFNTLIAGAGNDRLTGKDGGNDLDAGQGDNFLWATGDNNTLQAGAGNDYLDIVGNGNVLLAGDGNFAIRTRWSDAANDARCNERRAA